jgi:hypothetical protein
MLLYDIRTDSIMPIAKDGQEVMLGGQSSGDRASKRRSLGCRFGSSFPQSCARLSGALKAA